MLILISIIISFIVSSVFWLFAKTFLSALAIKPFKSATFCTLISLVILAVTNIEIPMGVLSVFVTLAVLNLIISILVLLSVSFYKNFLLKAHNKKIKRNS